MVAEVLPELSEVVGGAEKRVSWDVFVSSFEELLLLHWKVRPRLQQSRAGLVLGAGDGTLCAEGLVCLNTKWFRGKCMAGTYVFFECGGRCLPFGVMSSSLLFLRTSSFKFCPIIGFLSIPPLLLPAPLLLVDFAALPEAAARRVKSESLRDDISRTRVEWKCVLEGSSSMWLDLYSVLSPFLCG